jgi:putative transposase
MYTDLEDLIKRSPKPSEVKRGIAVKQDLAGKSRKLIGDILAVSRSFVSKWRIIYEEYGVNGLVSAHQGAKPRAFLSDEKKAEVLAHIQQHSVFGRGELASYLQNTHGVSYKHSQSYYDLLHEAGMSWHKSQKINPRRDEQKVQAKRSEIKKNFKKNEKPSKKAKP